ncbi:MAG: hypothetical protein ACUVYA_14000 [Planctomycetota bacterium]
MSREFLPKVPGHDTVKRYFRRAVETGRLSHAYLLLGPEGAGKRLFARELSKAFFCREGVACGECPPCRSIEHGNHPDVDAYRPAEGKTAIEIDAVRELCARTCYKREGLGVAVLERAELLSEPAANALLKTLEEPPGSFVIILTAQSSGTLLPTIVSRCHRVLFGSRAEAPGALPEPVASLFAELRRKDFFAGFDLREWISRLPDSEDIGTSRGRVRRLLEILADAGRSRLLAGDSRTWDLSLRRLERIVELRADLERNVHPELVLEAAIAEARSWI